LDDVKVKSGRALGQLANILPPRNRARLQVLKKKRSSSRRGSWQCGVGALAQVCATVFEVLFLFNLLTRSYRMNSNLDDTSSTSSILINISSSHVFGFWIARRRDFRRGDDGMVVAAQVGELFPCFDSSPPSSST